MVILMGKLILCSGERTKRPYGFASTGVRVYSIEELCYYLFHHIYLIEEEMFCEDLFDWMESELKLSERAQKLKLLKKQNADLKTLVTVVMCSSDYYTENEIKSMLKMLDEIIGMPTIKRNCIKAKNYLNNKQYAEAASEYERIINSIDAADLTPEEYGDLYHNLAVAKIYIAGLREAARLFCEAYERNHREESLRQYLYSLWICNREEYHSKVEEYEIEEEFKQNIEEFLEQTEQEALHCEKMREIELLKNMKVQGKISEYYKQADLMIETWKLNLRQH